MHRQPIQRREDVQSQRLVRAMLILNLGAILIMYLSTRWDAAEHFKGAVDRFWYPPHYGIYFGLLMAALLSLTGLIVVFRGPGLPFEKLRQNPVLSFVAVLNGLSFLGAPFDAWWHETFGIDLSAWSPPHVHLLVGTVIVIVGCVVYFLDGGPVNAPLEPLRPRRPQTPIYLAGLLLSVLLLLMLFAEYELLRQTTAPRFITDRPLWFYPLTWVTLTIFILMLYVALTRRVGLVSVGMALYVIVRLLLLGIDRTLLDYRGAPFYPLLLPALALDLTLMALGRPLRRGADQAPSWRVVTLTALTSSTVLVLTTPPFWAFFGVATDYTVQPWLRYWPTMLVVGVLSGLLGWACGTTLRRLRPGAQSAPSVQSQQVLAR